VKLDVDKIRSLDVTDREVLLWHELNFPEAFSLCNDLQLVNVVQRLLVDYLALVTFYTTDNSNNAPIVGGRQAVCQRKPVRHCSFLFYVTNLFCDQCTVYSGAEGWHESLFYHKG
jgi:hypothetical protein